MNKILLSLLLLVLVCKVKGQDTLLADTSRKNPANYNGGVIPDKADMKWDDEKPPPSTAQFKNPYDNVKIPDTAPQPVVQKDTIKALLDKMVSAPPSRETQSTNSSFDWNKTNADRFVHSPCITTLGFDPNADPKVQEQRYEDCESDLNQQMLKKGLLIGLIILGLSALVYFGIKSGKN